VGYLPQIHCGSLQRFSDSLTGLKVESRGTGGEGRKLRRGKEKYRGRKGRESPFITISTSL